MAFQITRCHRLAGLALAWLAVDAGLPASAATCVAPPAGLVAWLRAEGDVADAAGGPPGIVEYGTAFAAGRVGQAFAFDGIDDDVRLPHRSAQNGGSQMTVEAWVYPRSPLHGRVIVQKRAPTPPDGVGGFTFETTHSPYGADYGLQFIVWIAGTPRVLPTPAGVLQMNVWQHVAASYDGATMRVYVNGIERASQPMSGPVDASSEPLLLAKNAVYPALVWDGLIDEASLYNRALGASEVQALAAAGSAGKCVADLPPAVGGALTGMSLKSGKLVCSNLSTGKSATLSLPDAGRSWDCRRSGLAISPGDTVNQSLTVNGKAGN